MIFRERFFDFVLRQNYCKIKRFVGIVMRETKGTAKPQVVNEILKKQVENI